MMQILCLFINKFSRSPFCLLPKALALSVMILIPLAGCSVPGSITKPPLKSLRLAEPSREKAFKRFQDRPSLSGKHELAIEWASARGELYASLSPIRADEDKFIEESVPEIVDFGNNALPEIVDFENGVVLETTEKQDEIVPEIFSIQKEARLEIPDAGQGTAQKYPDFVIERNAKVEKYIKYYQNQRSGTFQKWLERYGRYGPMMRQILREYGLPEDLVFMAMVESGFSPYAYSRARATGPWQFISSTGRRYGLTINWWIDERRDPFKATHAAARFLTYLYEMFDSWPLAMAGYNAGEYRISRAMERLHTDDFWRIARSRYIKRETKQYVPRIMAAAIIAKNPEKYGFTYIEYQAPLKYDEVEINAPVDLNIVARSAGTIYEEIKALNPELKRGVTPPNYTVYHLKIPHGSTSTFQANFKEIATDRRTAWQRHRVRRGETIARIARRYGVSVINIVELNKLQNPHRIKVGDDILIPMSSRRAMAAAMADKRDGSVRSAGGGKNFYYTIRHGDNLSDIAREFGVSIEDILRLNNLRNPHRIYAGKKILVPAYDSPVLPGATVITSANNDRAKDGIATVELVNHRVKRNETLSDIALWYGVGVKRLARINRIRNVNRLRIGQIVKIPITITNGYIPSMFETGGKPPRGGGVLYKNKKYKQVFHILRRGDTLGGFAS